MTFDAVFWLTLGGFLTACFTAIGARSLADFSRHELEAICRLRGQRGRFGEILRMHERVALAVDNLLSLASTISVAGAAFLLWREVPADAATPATVAVADADVLGSETSRDGTVARPFLSTR